MSGATGKDGRDAFQEQRPGWPAPIHQPLVTHKVSAAFHGYDHFSAFQELDGVAYVMVPHPGRPGAEKLWTADEYGYARGTVLPPALHVRVTVGTGPARVRPHVPPSPRLRTATTARSHTGSSSVGDRRVTQAPPGFDPDQPERPSSSELSRGADVTPARSRSFRLAEQAGRHEDLE